jgi:hypothetical protein
VGQRAEGLGREDARGDELAEGGLDEAQAVLEAHVAPAFPAQDAGGVDEQDALDVGPGAGVEPGVDAPLEQQVGVGQQLGVGADPLDHQLDGLGLDLVDHGGEQLGLVGELVVERAPGHAGRLDDGLGAHRREAVDGEQLPGRADESGPGGSRSLGLGAALAFHTACM